MQKSGSTMPNLVGVQGIITLLRSKPTLATDVLRPLLKDHIPWFSTCNARLIANFKRKALKFIYENPPCAVPSPSGVLDLTLKNSAANEPTIEDSPPARTNLKEILRTIMQEGPDIWDALKLLKEYQDISLGLDYRVSYCPLTSKPVAICWMLPEMKVDAIRYGDVLFLDSQKRDMNTPGWPYIAPVVKDNENKIRVIAECLCIAESMENYAFVLESAASMEPRFYLGNIKIVFADQFINDTLLEDLRIKETCTLHGDYFHLMNKVFPETFKNRFKSIDIYLQSMILGDEEGWQVAYEKAHEKLIPYPDLLSELERIKSNPLYYSSWSVRMIPGTLFCKGSRPAEQNHSSAVAHLGKGGNLSISEHIQALTERQIHLNTKRCKADGDGRIHRRGYKAKHSGQRGENEVLAKKVLSNYGFQLFEKQTRSLLQCHIDDVTGSAEFWKPSIRYEERRDCESFFLWDSGYDRCPCHRRVSLTIQCRHEFSRENLFCKDKWSKRWLNDETYRADYAANAITHTTNTIIVNSDEEVIEEAQDDDSNEVRSPDSDLNDVNSEDEADIDDLDGDHRRLQEALQSEEQKLQAVREVTYQSLMAKMEELVRLVKNDQSLMTLVKQNVESMTHRVRSNASIRFQFLEDTRIANSQLPGDVSVGRLGRVPNAASARRLRSRHEISASYRKRGARRPRRSNDEEYAADNNKTRACSFCRRGGHTVNHCPKITIYGHAPIKGKAERAEFVQNLVSTEKFHVDQVPVLPHHGVAETFPKSCKGMVIHSKKRTVNGDLFYEVTVLNNLGDKHSDYREYPFSSAAIAKQISKGETFAVISFLRLSTGGIGDVGFGTPKPPPQMNTLTQQAQMSQLSQGSLPGSVAGLSQINFSQTIPTFPVYNEPINQTEESEQAAREWFAMGEGHV